MAARADHRGAADVDVLDEFVEVHAWLGGSFFKGVEIDDDHVDGLNAVLGDGGAVRGIFAAMKNSAVNLGMQRFHAAVEHFGKAGEVGDVFYFNSRVAQELGGSAGRNQFHAEGGKLAGEIGEAGFVGNAEDCALDFVGHSGILCWCDDGDRRFYQLRAAHLCLMVR